MKIRHQTTCFSTNIIYAIICKNCNIAYFGKVGEGKNGKNNFRSRTNDHLSKLRKLFNKVDLYGYYDENGKVKMNLRDRIDAFQSATLDTSYTNEVLHFLGLDKTDCYNMFPGTPEALYETFIIFQAKDASRLINEAILCKKEKYYQSQFCSIYHGMNGTVD